MEEKYNSFSQTFSNLKSIQISKPIKNTIPNHFRTLGQLKSLKSQNSENTFEQNSSFNPNRTEKSNELIKYRRGISNSILRYSQNLSHITKKESNNLKQKLIIFKNLREYHQKQFDVNEKIQFHFSTKIEEIQHKIKSYSTREQKLKPLKEKVHNLIELQFCNLGHYYIVTKKKPFPIILKFLKLGSEKVYIYAHDKIKRPSRNFFVEYAKITYENPEVKLNLGEKDFSIRKYNCEQIYVTFEGVSNFEVILGFGLIPLSLSLHKGYKLELPKIEQPEFDLEKYLGPKYFEPQKSIYRKNQSFDYLNIFNNYLTNKNSTRSKLMKKQEERIEKAKKNRRIMFNQKLLLKTAGIHKHDLRKKRNILMQNIIRENFFEKISFKTFIIMIIVKRTLEYLYQLMSKIRRIENAKIIKVMSSFLIISFWKKRNKRISKDLPRRILLKCKFCMELNYRKLRIVTELRNSIILIYFLKDSQEKNHLLHAFFGYIKKIILIQKCYRNYVIVSPYCIKMLLLFWKKKQSELYNTLRISKNFQNVKLSKKLLNIKEEYALEIITKYYKESRIRYCKAKIQWIKQQNNSKNTGMNNEIFVSDLNSSRFSKNTSHQVISRSTNAIPLPRRQSFAVMKKPRFNIFPKKEIIHKLIISATK